MGMPPSASYHSDRSENSRIYHVWYSHRPVLAFSYFLALYSPRRHPHQSVFLSSRSFQTLYPFFRLLRSQRFCTDAGKDPFFLFGVNHRQFRQRVSFTLKYSVTNLRFFRCVIVLSITNTFQFLFYRLFLLFFFFNFSASCLRFLFHNFVSVNALFRFASMLQSKQQK